MKRVVLGREIIMRYFLFTSGCALLPASAKRGSNSTPLKSGLFSLLPQTEIFQCIFQSHPVLDDIFRLYWILLTGYVCNANVIPFSLYCFHPVPCLPILSMTRANPEYCLSVMTCCSTHISRFNSIIRFPILYRKNRGKPCDKGISRFNNRKVSR